MVLRMDYVVAGEEALAAMTYFIHSRKPHKIAVISSWQVEAACGEMLNNPLITTRTECIRLYVNDGERAKRIENVARLWGSLVEANFTRKSLLVGFGGGSVCDLAGFVASTYMRGVPLVLVPTTLLSQIDAAIGAKNGIDFAGKNIIGTFYRPDMVAVDTGFLHTLPDRQMRNGLAEAVKVAIIGSEKLFEFLEINSDDIIARHEEVLNSMVKASIKAKLRIVRRDEREHGVRRILNFGHSFAHAFETLSDYTISHGEAVSMGMVVSARIAEKVLGFPHT